VLLDYLVTLERYRLLTFGRRVVRVVRDLERDVVGPGRTPTCVTSSSAGTRT
jgi:hypothetical protein